MGKLKAANKAIDSWTGNLMAGLGGIGLAGQSEDADAGVISKGGKRIIEAFHGSPHKFDRFSMDNIGTGEGAQAYGHGLYFADSEDVARGYRDQLSATSSFTNNIDAEPLYYALDMEEPESVDEMRPILERWLNDSRQWLVDEVEDGAATSDALTDFDAFAEAVMSDPSVSQKIIDGADVRGAFNAKAAEIGSGGSLYRVHIDADPDTLLDWDKPLSEQSESVKKLIYDSELAKPVPPTLEARARAEGVDPIKYNREQLGRMTGAEYYRHMELDASSRGLGSNKSASLRELGIPGIRYLDGNSRGAGDGTYNYVMFDDKPISIEERGFADPALLAGMGASTAVAAAASAFQQRREGSRGQWDALRQDLIQTLGDASEFIFESMEIPWKGLLGTTRVAGGLMSGESFNDAMAAGAQQVRNPLDQTAYDLGAAASDATGSPAVGAAVNTGIMVGGPI